MFAELLSTPGATLAAKLGQNDSKIDRVERAAGVDAGTVRAMINGESLPTIDDAAQLVALSRAAGVGLLTYRAAMTRDATQRDEPGAPLRFIMSTAEPDRYRDIVEQRFSLDGFSANPVAPWAHDYSTPPVGRWVDVAVEGGSLRGSLVFDESDENELGRLVASQYRRRFLSAVSVGFLPGSATPRARLAADHPAHAPTGFLFEENALLECSPVVVPGNAGALLVGRSECAPNPPRVEPADLLIFETAPVTVERLEWLDDDDRRAPPLRWLY